MRTLGEITESAMDGEMPTHEECYWAMLALRSLCWFAHHDLTNMIKRPNFGKMYAEEAFRRSKTAHATDPQKWLGPSHDPANPEMQKWREVAFKVLTHVERQAANREPTGS